MPNEVKLLPCELLESILPFIRFAQANGVPNAAYYAELVDGMIWSRPTTVVTDEVVERVKLAIHTARYHRNVAGGEPVPPMYASDEEYCERLALAAIEAMPTVVTGEQPLQSVGVPASPSGYSAEPEPSFTVSAVPVSIPNAEQSDEWKCGYAAGCAWYADYIQRIADIRERKSAVLRIAIQKLPEFSAYWSPERRDQWFEWFFDLLEQASAIEARSGETQSGNNNVNCPQTSGYMVPLCVSTEGESAVAKPDAQPDTQTRGQP